MRMKARKIILFVLCACLLSSPLKAAYAQAGPNLSSDTSVEAYISLLDADGVPTDIFYCAGGVISETSKVDGAYYEQSANTLYLSGFSTEQVLECSDMGDDFKIHVTGDCFVGQITIWGDGYGGSLYQEDRTERIKKLESRVRRLREIRMAQVVSHKIEDCRNCFGVMPVSL